MNTLEIQIKAFEQPLLKRAEKKILKILDRLSFLLFQVDSELTIEKKNSTDKNSQDLNHTQKIGNITIVSLPRKIKRFTVLRSPHIDKKSREQFEIRTQKKVIYVSNIKDLNCFNTLLQILKVTTFFGVQLRLKIQYSTLFS